MAKLARAVALEPARARRSTSCAGARSARRCCSSRPPGGDAEEIERFHLIDACGALLDAGRIKLYSCDSVNGRALLVGEGERRATASGCSTSSSSSSATSWCRRSAPTARPTTSRSSPRARRSARSTRSPASAASRTCSAAAICMSGTYDLRRFYDGEVGDDFVVVARRSTSCPSWTAISSRVLRTAVRACWPAGRAPTRTSASRGRWPTCSAPRASRTASTRGARSGPTTGRPGEPCCPATWTSWREPDAWA